MKLPIPGHFETERLQVLRLKHEDAEEIFYTYASKAEATKFVSWPTHQRLMDTRAYLVNAIRGWESGEEYAFVLRLMNGRLIGSCGLVNDAGRIQFGYILGPSHWGRGYATEVCSKLIDIVKSTPGVVSVGTFVDVENQASVKVLLKSGLTILEKREKWFRFVNQGMALKDCIVFKLLLS